jgi:hypothetical protein
MLGTPEPTPWPNPGSKPPGLDGRDKETNSAGSFRHHTTVPHEEDHMAVMTERSTGDTTIRPFTIDIPEAELEDLRARLAGTRFPDKETVEDDSQGVPLSVMQDLARDWATDYDRRKCEARLNAVRRQRGRPRVVPSGRLAGVGGDDRIEEAVA